MHAPEDHALDPFAEEELGVGLVGQLIAADAQEFEVVVVILKAPLQTASARALFTQAGVTASRQLTDTLWLIESPAGMASLEMANRLHASGLFASAQPNWWMKRALK
jgi:hypothetical protein